jgi:putative ABC transport system permease protein
MWKVTRKGLRANLVRFLLTAIAVILGVSFMSGTLVLTATVQRVFDDLFANIYRNTDVAVRAPEVLSSDFGSGERPNVPASLLRTVRDAPGVAGANGGVAIDYAQIIGKNGKAIGKPGQGPPTLGFAWDADEGLNPFHLIPGGHPPQDDDEVVIDKRSADKAKLHPGDRVRILSTKRPREYTLVGVARFGTADSPAGASASLFTVREAQRLANIKDEFSQISVRAAQGVSPAQLQRNIEQFLLERGNGSYEVITGAKLTEESQTAIHKQLGFFNIAFTIFALIALVVGAFIIYNTFSIVVAQRTRELALLRALGASQRQVLTEVIGESVVVGVLSSAAGVAFGLLLAMGLKALLGVLGFDIPSSGLVIRPSAVIVGLVIGSVMTILSAIVPARQAARIPPIAAMRDVAFERPPRRVVRFFTGGGAMLLGIVMMLVALFGNVDGAIKYVGLGAVLVFAGAFILGPLFARALSRLIGAPLTRIKGMTGTLARENASRNPKRTATTATSLLIGVALVGFITIFAASAKATVSDAVSSSFKSDYIIQSGGGLGPGAGLSPRFAKDVSTLPEIQAATPIRGGAAGINGSRALLFAVDPQAGAQVLDLGGNGSLASLGDNQIAVSKSKADDNHWKVGDDIPVVFVKTGTRPLQIGYVFDQNSFGAFTVDYYISLANYEKNYALQLDAVVLAKLKPGVTADQGRKALEPLLAPYETAKLQDNAQFKADQNAQINQVVAIVYVLLFLALFVALIGIANTLALSIHERTRELGLLRAVGMSRSQVRSAIRWESVIISILGTVNGLAIGMFFGWSVVRALKDDGFAKFAFAPGQLLLVVLVLAIASVGAAWLPARRAAKLDVLRAISTE